VSAPCLVLGMRLHVQVQSRLEDEAQGAGLEGDRRGDLRPEQRQSGCNLQAFGNETSGHHIRGLQRSVGKQRFCFEVHLSAAVEEQGQLIADANLNHVHAPVRQQPMVVQFSQLNRCIHLNQCQTLSLPGPWFRPQRARCGGITVNVRNREVP
jgi:hypothetical protein